MKNGQAGNKLSPIKIGVIIFCVIAAVITFFFIIDKFEYISAFFGRIVNILQPVIFGLVIAFLINPLSNFVTRHTAKLLKKLSKKNKDFPRLSLGIGIAASIATFILVIFALIYLIIPNFITSITSFVKDFSPKWEGILAWIETVFTGENSLFHHFYSQLPANLVPTVDKYLDVSEWMTLFEEYIGVFVTGVYNGILGVANFITDFVIGIMVAVYALASKPTFKAHTKKVLYATFNRRTVTVMLDIVKKSNQIFMGFINGKLINALIIGIISFIGFSIMGLPYPMLLTVIIAVTDLIPIFGPYIGTIPCAVLLLLYDPLKCLYFVIFIIVLQMVEGNIISPKILGESTGIPAFWVIFSILLGGGLFGILGMLLGVPVFAVFYYIAKRFFEHMLRRKQMPTETQVYMQKSEHINNQIDGEKDEQEAVNETK